MSEEELSFEQDAKELSKFIFDENCDGSIDTILEYKKNDKGQICELTLDTDCDDIADCKIFLEYDSIGRIERKAVDKNLSGKINSVETYEYDELGNKVIKYDDNADGKIDYMTFVSPNGYESIVDLRSVKEKIISGR